MKITEEAEMKEKQAKMNAGCFETPSAILNNDLLRPRPETLKLGLKKR
jgi:hypothetical protein